MKRKIKVCGMKFQDNIDEIVALQPDFMGFIFYETSPRNFENQLINVPKEIQKVGVFVNATHETIEAKVNQFQLDFIQLHGEETPELCEKIETLLVKVIKSFSIDKDFNFKTLDKYQNSCSYFLFDTKSKLYGGSGFAFDWNLLNQYNLDKPYFLSGGIGLENSKDVKAFLKTQAAKNCFALDLNSKFETEPGLKNKATLSQFINEINNENKL